MSCSIRSTRARSAVNSRGGGAARRTGSPRRAAPRAARRRPPSRAGPGTGRPPPSGGGTGGPGRPRRRSAPARRRRVIRAARPTRPWMSRSRSPGRQDMSDSCSAAAASAPSSRRSSCSAGERVSLRPISSSVASSPNPGCPSAASGPLHAGDVLRGPDERARVMPGDRDQVGEPVAARLVLLAHPVGFHLGGHQRRPGVGGHHPRPGRTGRSGPPAGPLLPVAQATLPGPVSTTPAMSSRPPSQPSRRSRAASARATLRGECSAIPSKVL